MKKKTTVDCIRFRDSITDYLEGATPPALTLAFEQHRTECEGCEEVMGQVLLTIEALGSLKRERPSDPIPPGLLGAFRDWRNSAGEDISDDLELIVQELVDRSESERGATLGSIPRDRLLDLGNLATDKAAQMGIEAPRTSVRLAQLGVEILETVRSSGCCSDEIANDNLGRALAVLGNCRRICSDFKGAGEAFERAGRSLDLGTREAQKRADLFQVRAQYLADLGNLREAISDLDEAALIYRETADRHSEGRTLIGKGRVLGSSGYVEDAIPCLTRGLELIDKERDVRLVLVAKHNLVEYLSTCGSRDQALQMLEPTRELHRELSNSVDLIRFKWLEGKIALDLGDLEAAEALLSETKSYFVEHEMAHDVAVVSLDLSLVFLKQGRTAELKELSNEMVTIFSGLGIRREIFAALAFFNKAQEIEQTATVGLLQELVEVLENTRQRGGLRPQLSMPNQV